MVHGLEAEYWGQVDFLYIDREDPANKDVVQQFGVRYQPVFVLLDAEGNILEQWAGNPGEEALRNALNSLQTS